SVIAGLEQIDNPAAPDLLLKNTVPEARTLHRLLGYSPARGRFLFHRNNKLEAKAVIVDEGSMLDLSLMERLVSALEPDAQLIVLGDADQLPSVAAGAVFRDLAGAASGAQARDSPFRGVCKRLTHSYWMDTSDASGSAVFSAARAINSGDEGV